LQRADTMYEEKVKELKELLGLKGSPVAVKDRKSVV